MNIRAFVSMSKKGVILKTGPEVLEGDHQLIFDFGSYDLTDKEIYLVFEPSGYIAEQLQPKHGLVFLPLDRNMIRRGINELQFEFIKGDQLEKSPVIYWNIEGVQHV